MKRLFHISEDSSIEVFEPRLPKHENSQVAVPIVWATDDEHFYNYLVPRDCPRVSFHRLSSSTEEDLTQYFGASEASSVLVIEGSWLQRAVECELWAYEFASDGFECVDSVAGYYVCKTAVTPRIKAQVSRPLTRLVQSGTELRVVNSLETMINEVVKSSLGFSIIRAR
jgi:hypothetical protein